MNSGRLIRQTAAYTTSSLALASAANIIETKILNTTRLLARYRHPLLLEKLNRLAHLASRAQVVQNKVALFSIEATAAREYWQIFALLAHQGPDWRRVHPHATDTLNLLLNIGYVTLGRKCLEAINDTGLLPELGLLHSDNSGQALVYDFMEVFRPVAVDRVILPIFSRRSVSKTGNGDKTFRKVLALLNLQYQKASWYERRCERLENIIRLEAVKLKQAILTNKIWRPYRHQWSRHHICK